MSYCLTVLIISIKCFSCAENDKSVYVERGGVMSISAIRKGVGTLCFASLVMIMQSVQAEEIDRLLSEFSHKNDASRQTIDQNKGHLVLFTRERIERMHAKTLKDVMKLTPFIYYHENRYALPDPLSSGSFEPYRSNFIRLFIDGVEVTQGWLGSGLVLYGDMDIDFADHIEFYYMTPSFETSVEPAFLTIFIYSKEPERDSGTQLDLMVGSRGYNVQSINYGGKKEGVSYMLNLSRTHEKREKIDNGSPEPLYRDFDRLQLMGYVKTDRQNFHLQLMRKETDALAGLSYDATPTLSQIDYENIHMDYRFRINDDWKVQFAYDTLFTDTRMADDMPLLFVDPFLGKEYCAKTRNSTYSAELTYARQWGDHRIATGLKARAKVLDLIKEERFGTIEVPFDEEDVWSVFFQDQYALSQNQMLSIGIEYSHIRRNSNKVDNDNLLQLRVGYLYSAEHWNYKAYLYRSTFALDPFSTSLLTTIFAENTGVYNTLQTTWGLTQEVGYKSENYRVSLMLFLLKDEEGLLVNGGEGNTKYVTTVFQYMYEFDLDNRVDLQLYYAGYEDIFQLAHLDDYSGYVSFMNSYGAFEFYNGMVWHRNSIDNKNYFDLTGSVSWNINEDLTVTVRGENILDKAKKTALIRVDPATGSLLTPLHISPIDRRIVFELEYQF